MKKFLPVIAIVLVFVVGLCVLLYPVISAILSKMSEASTIVSYQNAVEDLTDTDIDKLKADAQKYNETLYGAILTDPFASEEDLDTSYVELLNVNEVMGYIEIPKIKVYLPIFHGSTPEVLEKGVGHLESTSLPIGGESTHAVLTGHRGLPSATLFTDLDQLVEGDEFYVHILDEVLAYKVDQIKVVEPEDTKDITIVQGKDYVTLVTCTPYGINTQRLLIRGERTEYIPEEHQTQASFLMVNEVIIVPAVFIALASIPIVLLVRKKRKAKK